jgi:hypothetical protein
VCSWVDSDPVPQGEEHVLAPATLLTSTRQRKAVVVPSPLKETLVCPPVVDWITAPELGELIVGVAGGVTSAKVAVTDLSALIRTVHPPLPEQLPDHSMKVWPAAGAAVREMLSPSSKMISQVPLPQRVAVPCLTAPEPLTVMVSFTGFSPGSPPSQPWAGQAALAEPDSVKNPASAKTPNTRLSAEARIA